MTQREELRLPLEKVQSKHEEQEVESQNTGIFSGNWLTIF